MRTGNVRRTPSSGRCSGLHREESIARPEEEVLRTFGLPRSFEPAREEEVALWFGGVWQSSFVLDPDLVMEEDCV